MKIKTVSIYNVNRKLSIYKIEPFFNKNELSNDSLNKKEVATK
jgi:hypothetical protein